MKTDAAKRKSLIPAAHAAARFACLVVALLLAQTSVWGFGISQEHASAHFAELVPSSVEGNAVAIGYDVSDCAVAANSAVPPVRTTVIGRMHHLERFADDAAVDTWAKSGRIPAPGEPPVTWAENLQWLKDRVARGDKFGIATDPATLPPVKGGYIPGQPNGYFTARELEALRSMGIEPTPMH